MGLGSFFLEDFKLIQYLFQLVGSPLQPANVFNEQENNLLKQIQYLHHLCEKHHFENKNMQSIVMIFISGKLIHFKKWYLKRNLQILF